MPDLDLDITHAKVLMVDDTPANIDVLHKVLEPEGYKLFFAKSGERALQIAEKAVPDLILLDVMMPNGIDGFETCSRLKQNPLTQSIPVIFITAKTETEDLVEAFKVGAVDYITKPFRQEEVCSRVKNHLKTRFLGKRYEELIQNLKTNEERFRILANLSPIGIFQTDLEGFYIYTNQQWQTLFGLFDKSSYGTTWLTLVDKRDQTNIEEIWHAYLKSPESVEKFSATFRIYSSTGELRWVQKYAKAVLGEDNQVVGFIGTVEDITNFKQREAEILHAKETAEARAKDKADFLAGMAHELRTPLNAIIGYSELLTDSISSGEESEDAEKITSAGRYLLNLINNLLDLSKLEANKMSISVIEFKLSPLIKEVTQMIMPLVQGNHNQLIVEVDETIESMMADDTKIRQILYNLLSNACKFTKQGKIRLWVHSHEQFEPLSGENKRFINFTIQDNGIGMNVEQLSKLFTKYSQATEEISRHYGGTGLGLVLSRQFCRLMGGDIFVESESGKGSTFTATIPQFVTVLKTI